MLQLFEQKKRFIPCFVYYWARDGVAFSVAISVAISIAIFNTLPPTTTEETNNYSTGTPR
jgi:hypothetical protein